MDGKSMAYVGGQKSLEDLSFHKVPIWVMGV